MDANYRIYRSDEGEEIPAEDRARLDGFLRGRAEADKLAEVEKLQAQIREMEGRGGD